MAMKDKRNGFTLIELLVVIALIALLMAILLPTLGRVKRQAQAVVCRSNLRQWGVFFDLYTQQNDGKFFAGSGTFTGVPFWTTALKPYYEDEPDILLCPRARTYKALPGVSPHWGGGSRSAWQYGPTCSYGTNNWIATAGGPTAQVSRERAGRWGTPLIGGASDIPVFLDCMFGGGGPSPWSGPPTQDDVHKVIGGDCMMGHFCVNRHDGAVNSLFMDWSVWKVGLKELWTLKWSRDFDTRGTWTRAGGAEPEQWPEWMRGFRDY